MQVVSAPGSDGSSDTNAPHAAAKSRRRGGALYFVASVAAQAAALLRYVALARLLGPEQLGIAATLVVTASFFDLISDTGSDRFLIQDRHGDEVQVQKLVQLVYAGRGFMVACGLVIFAVPFAHFYNVPRLAEGLAILALSPLILGFQHLDYRRAQRGHDFRPEAICMLGAEPLALTVTIVAAWLTRDFTAILYGLITRSVVMVVVSHLQAKRPYRFGLSRPLAGRLRRFALPLMLNGLMLFILSQSDRVIVGNQLGVKALGYYSAVVLLIFYPSVLLARYVHAIYIPLIAAQRDHPVARGRVSDNLGGQTVLQSVAMAIGFAVLGPSVVPILFGGRFAQTPLLVGLIGILQTTRYFLNWPSTVALSIGRTTTVLLSNLAHLFAFVGAYIGALTLGGLNGVVTGFVVGELIAVAAAMALLNRDMGRAPFHGFGRIGEFGGACVAIVAADLALEAHQWAMFLAVVAVFAAFAAWLVWQERTVLTETAAEVRRLLQRLSRLRAPNGPRAEVEPTAFVDLLPPEAVPTETTIETEASITETLPIVAREPRA